MATAAAQSGILRETSQETTRARTRRACSQRQDSGRRRARAASRQRPGGYKVFGVSRSAGKARGRAAAPFIWTTRRSTGRPTGSRLIKCATLVVRKL
ncbi:hypothetical protein MTO96_049689 [Rhipicephalus appendiculatus]